MVETKSIPGAEALDMKENLLSSGTHAWSLDIDGVIVETQHRVQIGALKRYFIHGKGGTIYNRISEVPVVDRTHVQDTQLGVRERVSLKFHEARSVDPFFIAFVSRHQGETMVANTGRPFHEKWVEMTKQSFHRNGIADRIEGVFHKPEGIKTAVSKAAGIEELLTKYETVTHIDDNPADVLSNAEYFLKKYGRQVQFVIKADYSTSLLLKNVDWSKYPNVKVVGSFEELDGIQSDGSEARNSWIRKLTEQYVNPIADMIADRFPISANWITITGGVGVGVGAGLAHRAQHSNHPARDKMIALAVEGGFAALDGGDGLQARALIRRKRKKGERIIPDYWGALLDTIMDRLTNGGMAGVRAFSAHERGSMWGENAALAMLMASPLSALGRKHAERNLLLVVNEDGGLGSQFGRMIAQIVITAFPTIKGIEIQPIVDTVLAAMAAKVGWDRFRADKQPGEKTSVLEATYYQAGISYPALWAFTATTVVAALAVYKHLHKDRS